jgi:hypothetical protein
MRLAALVAALAACATEPAEPQRFVLQGDDVVVEKTVLRVPIAAHPEIEAARDGDLIAGVQGGGYVRRVLDVGRAGGALVFATEDVPIGDAVGAASSSLNEGKADGTSHSVRFDFETGNTVLHDGDVIAITVDRSSLAFTPTLDLDFELSGATLEHFLAAVGGHLRGDITFAVRTQGAGRWNVVQPTFRDSVTFVQMIGWVPVIEVVEIEAGVGVEVTTAGAIDVQLSGDFASQLRTGVEYAGGWDGIGEATTGAHAGVTEAQGAASSVHGYTYAKLHVWMYDVTGPYLDVRPGLKFSRSADGAWSRAMNLSVHGGAVLDLPLVEEMRYDAQLIDRDWGL